MRGLRTWGYEMGDFRGGLAVFDPHPSSPPPPGSWCWVGGQIHPLLHPCLLRKEGAGTWADALSSPLRLSTRPGCAPNTSA